MMSRIWAVVLGCAMLILAVGCGGGGSSTAALPTPTPTPAGGTPTVTSSTAAVPLNGTQQFSATNFSSTVTWTISPSVGTINSTSGLYTAPATFPASNAVTVTATAGTQTASKSITVVYPNDNAASQTTPIPLGTSGGNSTDVGTTVCCIGTLGSLWTRADLPRPVILSNNHVLDKSSFGTPGTDVIDQPGQNACFGASTKPVAVLTQGAALAPAGTTQGRTGASPSNTDSAIATINTGAVDLTGTILDLGAAGPSSIAAAPPSATLATPALNQAVAKSGRTTGLTCSTVTSISTSVQVAYETSCGSNVTAFNATYTGQVVINGGSFSAGGDSGSLIVTQATARPVALLYGGSTTDTVANPIQDVVTALSNGANTLTPVGGVDHAVSCQPTASANSKQVGAQSATVPLSATERQRVTLVQQHNGAALLRDSAIRSVEAGPSADNPGEGALLIHLTRATSTPIPATIDGVRTRVVYDNDSAVPSIGEAQIAQATAIKEAHVKEFLGQGGIQGFGVTVSADNPAETAVSVYVIQGMDHPPIPATIDGVRTRIFTGSQFKAY
ncbi:MAG TPA: hypothetical protein VFB79_05275 [Candidatus Angelobacter sp.]|nr:hypothetical protein [Candidatus Angelobacter sp.]